MFDYYWLDWEVVGSYRLLPFCLKQVEHDIKCNQKSVVPH